MGKMRNLAQTTIAEKIRRLKLAEQYALYNPSNPKSQYIGPTQASETNCYNKGTIHCI